MLKNLLEWALLLDDNGIAIDNIFINDTVRVKGFSGERSGSVVECLTRDRGATFSSLTGVTALCPLARHINPSLLLVQPRRTRPCITERMLMGRKESNQTNKMKGPVNHCMYESVSNFFLASCDLSADNLCK